MFLPGMIALAFNLRGAITSLPPVFPDIAGRLNWSPAVIAALAALPVLCFAVFSPVAAPLSRRFGEERVLLGALTVLTAGLLLRGASPALLLFPGTVLAGAAIALMNVLLPSLVKRRQPGQAGLLIGVYLLSLSAGAILGSLMAVPVYRASGGSIPLTAGVWAAPALLAALAWLPQRRFRTLPAEAGWKQRPGPGTGRLAGRRPVAPPAGKVSGQLLAWQVMGFMGLQSLTYYTALSWLPFLFRDRGTSAAGAGTLLALMNLGNAATALLVPMLAHRARDQQWLVAVTIAASGIGFACLWFAPLAGAVAWTLLLGLGQGAGLGLAIYFTMARAPDPVTSASLSSFAQGAGYLVASAGPLAFGFLHTLAGGWTVPVLVLLAIFGGEFVAGWLAGRDRTLRTAAPAAVAE